MSLRDKLDHQLKQAQLRQHREHDLPDKLNDWKTAIFRLYEQVKSFLKEYETNGTLTFEEEPLEIHEDLAGSYDVTVLRIKTPSNTVVLTPIGLFILGANGRVDMRVHGGDVQSDRIALLRSNTPSDDAEWLIPSPPASPAPEQVISKGPYKYMPFCKETFESTLDFMLS